MACSSGHNIARGKPIALDRGPISQRRSSAALFFCPALRAFVASLKESADEALVDEACRYSGPVIHYGGEPSCIRGPREVQCGIEKVQ